ncbi:hypothetical protein F5Y16DRAFT_392865 [Xylariaceae sp. FL0255]|nr:hypothetical protein F5Y16DRAFT_392865 [Xylariaceae sp. FL0255]
MDIFTKFYKLDYKKLNYEVSIKIIRFIRSQEGCPFKIHDDLCQMLKGAPISTLIPLPEQVRFYLVMASLFQSMGKVQVADDFIMLLLDNTSGFVRITLLVLTLTCTGRSSKARELYHRIQQRQCEKTSAYRVDTWYCRVVLRLPIPFRDLFTAFHQYLKRESKWEDVRVTYDYCRRRDPTPPWLCFNFQIIQIEEECTLCANVMTSAYKLLCGHYFCCRCCVTSIWLFKICPICRQEPDKEEGLDLVEF